VRALPGVGRYTAGAILSIAYRKPEPVLDGNVIRVLTRLQRIEGDPRGAAVQRVLWEIAGRLVAEGDPADTNQALMELGAVVCHPREPACLLCPVARRCAARREGDVERFPSPTRATRVVAIDQVAVALVRRGRVLLARRPPRGLWGGLLELPTGAPRPGETLAEAARRVARERVGLLVTRTAPLAHFRHVLSHRRITFHGFRGDAPRGRVRLDGYDGHRWVDLRSAVGLGISRATARLLAALTEDAA
jgi:A/G-specific adenine glycosylase